MLNNIPRAINRMVRNVVINHPNSLNCVCVRKVVTRPAGEDVAGFPTLGGMSVIDSYDEEQYEYMPLGNGFALKTEMFQPSLMMDSQDANNGQSDDFHFMIEPENAGEFELIKNDVMYLLIGDVRLAFEIVWIETTSDIPPYTQRYICNRRNDLNLSV